MKTIVISGIPGVGKSTILRELEALAKEEGAKLTTLNFGTMMGELYKKSHVDLHRDELRSQPINMQKKMQEKTARVMAKKVKSGILLIDTHMFIRTRSGFWPGLPSQVLSILKPLLLVLVEASPENIVKRREGDPTRIRDRVTMYDVMSDLDWARACASSCATETGAPVKIIMNEPGKQREAAQQLFESIRELGG
jgi:adenylate kinase